MQKLQLTRASSSAPIQGIPNTKIKRVGEDSPQAGMVLHWKCDVNVTVERYYVIWSTALIFKFEIYFRWICNQISITLFGSVSSALYYTGTPLSKWLKWRSSITTVLQIFLLKYLYSNLFYPSGSETFFDTDP